VGQPDAHLTARELQVARLVAEGMTNRQVGEALYLSPKTVGIHLSRVYAKLGVSRRAALAARLARHLPGHPGPDQPFPG
ncbi:MAG TPA: helix-turn-helix transcriptional regulator, partial [Pilimelia sp.]|nr:helix-turn-helix transcriptional regulator [Pilimelia sp.]